MFPLANMWMHENVQYLDKKHGHVRQQPADIKRSGLFVNFDQNTIEFTVNAYLHQHFYLNVMYGMM